MSETRNQIIEGLCQEEERIERESWFGFICMAGFTSVGCVFLAIITKEFQTNEILHLIYIASILYAAVFGILVQFGFYHMLFLKSNLRKIWVK